MASANVDIVLKARDEATAALNNAAGSIGKMMGSVSKLSVGLLAANSALVGLSVASAAAASAVGLVRRLSDEVEQLDNLSASSGVSARNLQVLQFAFRQGGVDAAALTQGLNFLNRSIASNDPALAKLGVTSRNTFEAFLQAAQGIARTADASERARLTFEVFGRGGAQLIPILTNIAGNFGGLAQAAERSGNVLGGVALQRMRDVDAAMDKMAASANGLSNQLAVGLAPGVASVTNAFTGLLRKMEEVQRKGEEMRQRGNPEFLRAMGFGRSGGGGDFSLPPGWGEVGPGGRGTSEFGPGNTEGINAMRVALAEAQKKAMQRALEGWRTLQLSEGGSLNVREQVGFGMTDSDAQLRGGGGTPMLQIGPMVDQAKEHLTTFSELMQKVAGDIKQTFDIIGSHLHNSIVGVFMNLTNKAQTFRSAIVSIFQSVRDGILQAIGEIVAAQVVRMFLKILGIALSAMSGNPFFAAAGGASPGGGTFGGSGGPVGMPLPAGNMMSPGGTMNVTIQTINAKDTLDALVSPTGSFRKANTRLLEVAAAG